MNLSADEVRTLLAQFSLLHDERLTAEQFAELDEQIRTNPAVRRLYVNYSRILGGLRQSSVQESLFATVRGSAARVSLASDDSPALGAGDNSMAKFSLPFSWQKNWLPLLGAGFTGALLATAVLLWSLPKRSQSGSTPSQVIAQADPKDAMQVRSLKLESGAATLAIANVGHVVVEGPAEFDFLSPKRARLTYGRIKMRVTEETGRGFVVETPGGEVIDLGTEFGIDVDRGGKTSLAVFEGKVDLRRPTAHPGDTGGVEHFEVGEGAVVSNLGEVDRLMSIVTGNSATFRHEVDGADSSRTPMISKVTDNLRKAQTKKFYEIIPRGLREDAMRYVDRPEVDWNGVGPEGMPPYLIGADYVKTFNDLKMRSDVRISVAVARPVRLFIFFDDRLESPAWLTKEFHNTGDKIGADFGRWKRNSKNYAVAKGAGVSIDAIFSVWERIVEHPGTVQLGHNTGKDPQTSSMYGIAAVPWEPRLPTTKQQPPET
jgi:hypothetical protein